MSYQAFINSLPPPYEPKQGERVKLLRYDHCATKGVTHEVRQGRFGGFGIFFGSKKDCLRYIEAHGLKLGFTEPEQSMPSARGSSRND